MGLDVGREVECMLAGQSFGQIGIAVPECRDDVEMIDDRALGPIIPADRDLTNPPDMKQQVTGHVGQDL